jgi:hypothetical protein
MFDGSMFDLHGRQHAAPERLINTLHHANFGRMPERRRRAYTIYNVIPPSTPITWPVM